MSLRRAYRAGLAALARNWISQRPLYLAIETTGAGRTDELIAIAILEHDGAPLIDTRVRPAQAVGAVVSAQHGRTDAALRQAPRFDALAPTLAAHLAGRTLVIHNATFALRLLMQSAYRHGCPQPPARSAFCAMQLYAAFHGEWDGAHHRYRWHTLAEAAEHIGLASDAPVHGARARAALTRQLLHALADAPPAIPRH